MQEDPLVTDIAELAGSLQLQRGRDANDTVEQFFNTAIPEKLWHYTTVSALESMLCSGRVWATEARHTTDARELVHAKSVALAFLNGLKPESQAGRVAKTTTLQLIAEEFETGSLSQEGCEVFVASFSSAKDLKSQWIDYADKGRGVSIAFDLTQIRLPREAKTAVTLAPCIYQEDKAGSLVKTALGHYIEASISLHENVSNIRWVKQKLDDWRLIDHIYGVAFDRVAFDESMRTQFTNGLRVALTLTRFDLLRLASHCKDSFFTEEQEWRLALPHLKRRPLIHSKVEYRGKDGSIPYIAHDLFKTGLLPIREVMLGPLCEGNERVEAALKQYGYSIPVTRSSGPMRLPASILAGGTSTP